ncbi:PAS domain-containing protein [Candidatus Poribacteria bacterium]|nr:PAS domain-containing protein [Candidatus Poribacteria bacterium]
MAIVQDPDSAEYDGMPQSAINTGMADYILPPDKMPEQLFNYVQHAFDKEAIRKIEKEPKNDDWLQKVFILLRDYTGHDFSHYKQNTILRRIQRRMTVHQIMDQKVYVRFLQENPEELEVLFKELLIGVTHFFRDPEAFDVLKEKAIPDIFKGKSRDNTIKIWVPGCSTGEEAYSIAILVQEHMNKIKKNFEVQVFATDIDNEAIENARLGIYPDSIAGDITPERLKNFFIEKENQYQIKRKIRNMLVFSIQNVVKDPSLSKIDIISCRNLLIYMGEKLQKKLLPLFHYSLKPNGYLFLGTSESTSSFDDLFETVDRKWKLFKKKSTVDYTQIENRALMDFTRMFLEEDKTQKDKFSKDVKKTNYKDLVENILLKTYSPACVLIDNKYDILYVHGRTGKYLEQPQGEASLNILEMARKGLKMELSTAIRKVVSKGEENLKRGLFVKTNGETQMIDLIVKPITDIQSHEDLLLLIFRDIDSQSGKELTSGEDGSKSEEELKLERELEATKQYLQTTIEELETSNEELKSTNEELQSSNEELQSTNEELETSKEELQSVNEELTTVNAELENKLDQLHKANNDMNNLLVSTEIATIFLDEKLQIKLYTPKATEAINLIQSDIGRPLKHTVSNLKYEDLIEDAKEVLNTLESKEVEVQSNDGKWFSIKIFPYRTTDNVIEGVIINFIDITKQKKNQKKLQEQKELLEESNSYITAILDTVRESLLVLDVDLKVVSANMSFYDVFQVEEDTEGKLVYDLGDGQWDIPDLRELLDNVISKKKVFNDYKVEHDFPNIGKRIMLLNARRVELEKSHRKLILLAIEDITQRAGIH